MLSLNYTQQFALCVLGQKPKLNAFKRREVAACLVLSEIVELLRDGTIQLTADEKNGDWSRRNTLEGLPDATCPGY
ncbi:hypothetical protein [Lentilactobacillus kisonensis]|uniref:hypothetical protein n=1 Tax=Lentilactobacillus kisonensis TaxID=481722 RepID=UPI000A504992|nr:hypothetical protein [Lentilactobacillus kisonensis]